MTRLSAAKSIGSALICLTCLLPTAARAEITKGPYIQRPGRGEVRVMWESDDGAAGVVRYGTDKEMAEQARVVSREAVDYRADGKETSQTVRAYLYDSRLTGLAPGTGYFYRVECGQSLGPVSRFTTSPAGSRRFTFVALGDSRTNVGVHSSVAAAVRRYEPDLIISMGDLVSRGGNYHEWGPQFFQPLKDIIDHIPFWSTLGDHDTVIDDGLNFHRFFWPDREELYFSFDYANAHFVSLDYRLESDPDMAEWLKRDLKASDADWKIVYYHRPTYNIGGHRSTWGREPYAAIYREHGVDLVLAGHSHIYERFYPLRPRSRPNDHPVTYITTGGSGAELYDSPDNPFLAAHGGVHHYMVIEVEGPRLSARALDLDGKPIDSFEMVKEGRDYRRDYMSQIKDEDWLDIMTGLAARMVPEVGSIPTGTKPARVRFRLDGHGFAEATEVTIGLAPESKRTYRLGAEGRANVKPGETVTVEVDLYADGKVEARDANLEPPLYFHCAYKSRSYSGEFDSGRIRYNAGRQY